MIVTTSPTRSDLLGLVATSLDLIAREQAPTGAYPACPTYPVYRYCWLRDGSFLAEAMSAHGVAASASAFHRWVAGVVTRRASRIEEVIARTAAAVPIEPSLYLPTRYTLDGEEGSEDWWDFQLDGYGTWLWALHRYLHRHGGDAAGYRDAVSLVVRYLAATWRQPCFDWWEEHSEAVHVSTLAAICAGLAAAADGLAGDEDAALARRAADEIAAVVLTDGVVDGRLRKWLGSTAVDATLLSAVAPFQVVDGPVAVETVSAVEARLLDDGGVHRFEADVFYGGGRWPVLAGLLGQAYVRLGRADEAWRQLEWVAATADDHGRLPEQVSDRLFAPAHHDEWVRRWGPVARPLLWSHAAFLSLAADLEVRA